MKHDVKAGAWQAWRNVTRDGAALESNDVILNVERRGRSRKDPSKPGRMQRASIRLTLEEARKLSRALARLGKETIK